MFHKAITPLEKCQLKFASNDAGEFEGYASVFNHIDKVGDTIAPGAFRKTLDRGQRFKMFVNHKQHEVPVGDWVSASEDEYGLRVKGVIDLNHKDGPTVYSALKRGAMDALSVGFTMSDSDYEKSDAGRLIKNMSLMEVSIVSFPCEGRALISAVKADLEGFTTLKDYENYLREVGGFSGSMATAIVSQIVKTVRGEREEQRRQMQQKASAEVLAVFDSLKTRLN